MEGTEARGLYGDACRTRGGVVLDRKVRWFLIALALVAIGLVGSNIVFYLARFGLGQSGFVVPPLLDLDHERNLPTFFSGVALTILAWLSLRIGLFTRRSRSGDSRFWFVIAGALYYVSFDEIAELHERLTEPVREALGLSGLLYFAWVVPAIIALAILMMICLRFLFQMEARMRFLFLLAAILYVGGALGMELVGGYFAEARGYDNPMYIAAAIVEESGEIAGILVLMYALFRQSTASDGVDSVPPALITESSTRVPVGSRQS